MNTTPLSDRLHIAVFGRTNTGKSSLINALAGQPVSVVSDIPGTTTDPVHKTMELSGLGPVVLFDTPGLDDTSELGHLRIDRTEDVLRKADVCLLVSSFDTWGDWERAFLGRLRAAAKPLLVVLNKTDLAPDNPDVRQELDRLRIPWTAVSALTGRGIPETRLRLAELFRGLRATPPTLIGDLVRQGSLVLLVVPIDTGAPQGRLILPQVQVIRDALDHDSLALVVKERELPAVFRDLRLRPDLVVCDSQAVLKTVAETPSDIPLTTFSILFARVRGDLAAYVRGVKAVDRLKDGDRVLVLEACTHHPLPDDIGRVKIPRWLRQYTGKDLVFETVAGPRAPRDLSAYSLVVSCGGCMINRNEALGRIADAERGGVPITNYGVLISYVQGVLKRSLSPFPYEASLL